MERQGCRTGRCRLVNCGSERSFLCLGCAGWVSHLAQDVLLLRCEFLIGYQAGVMHLLEL